MDADDLEKSLQEVAGTTHVTAALGLYTSLYEPLCPLPSLGATIVGLPDGQSVASVLELFD